MLLGSFLIWNSRFAAIVCYAFHCGISLSDSHYEWTPGGGSLLTAMGDSHGIVEVPAAILATAAVIYPGAKMATPSADETFGKTWVRSIADWAQG
jgi:hypothetical protein